MHQNTAFWLQLAALIFQVCAFIVFALQLRASRQTLLLTTLVQRRELYVNLTHSLPAETVDAMMLHAFDHFDMKIFNEYYRDRPQRIKSYLLMKRKYFYLVLASSITTLKADPLRLSPTVWIEELCKYKEFHDVHASHSHYYPQFKMLVDPIISKVSSPTWALLEEMQI